MIGWCFPCRLVGLVDVTPAASVDWLIGLMGRSILINFYSFPSVGMAAAGQMAHVKHRRWPLPLIV